MPRPYFLLATRASDGAPFAPQFGDFSRAVVADEARDSYRDVPARHRRIVRCASARQRDVDAALAALNAAPVEPCSPYLARSLRSVEQAQRDIASARPSRPPRE